MPPSGRWGLKARMTRQTSEQGIVHVNHLLFEEIIYMLIAMPLRQLHMISIVAVKHVVSAVSLLNKPSQMVAELPLHLFSA